MPDLPDEISADNKSANQESNGQAQQIQAAKTNKGIKPLVSSIINDDVFKLIGCLAIVCWMVHEFVFDAHQIFLFLAISLGLAEAFYVLGHKILRGRMSVAICWMIYAVCIFAIFKNEAIPEPKSKDPVMAVVTQPDLIDGTEYTRRQLQEFFPFGYAVIYPSENNRPRYEVVRNGDLEWSIDWPNVKIDPDFVKGSVTFTVPQPTIRGGRHNITVGGSGALIITRPLKKGVPYPFQNAIGVQNEPEPFVILLNDNQAGLIFAVGFRVRTAHN